MTLYIGIYLFMTVCTAFAVIDAFTYGKVISSLIFGLTWPAILTIRIIAKIIN